MRKKLFGTLVFYIAFGVLIILYLIPALILAVLPVRWRYSNRLYGYGAYLCYWVLLKATCLRIVFQGAHYVPQTPAILIANHQSLLDIPLLGYLSRGIPNLWLLKEELAQIPIFGFFVKRMGIVVSRRTLGTAMGTLTASITAARGDHHMMIFPEGGRFIDGAVHPFFSGFALIAQKTQWPVVPVFIRNIGKAYPPGSFWIYDYPISITVGEPMILQEGENERTFMHRVYQWFVRQQELEA